MCAFCVAILAAVAVGANLNSKQLAARRIAEEKGTKLPAEKPIVKATVGVVVLLTAASVVYHTTISPL
ncbi:MAG: hypothetical protein ABSA51_03140 [Anaerolineaceae bacterium]|jgi:uncharacterized membrane protein SpoIIM required for sporulation